MAMTPGDARRWRELEAIKAKGEIYRLERERDTLRRALVMQLRSNPISLTRQEVVRATKQRLGWVAHGLVEATAKLHRLEWEARS